MSAQTVDPTRSYVNVLSPSSNGGTVRANAQQPRLYTAMVLILIFSEVLGLYGLIVSILMLSRSTLNVTVCLS